jgi:DNA-binding CsgD family transcriptional regulator
MLLGREAEQRRVQDLLNAAQAGRSGALVLVGEPGVGKTALLEEAAERAAGFQVLRALGTEAEAELPFAAVFDILRPISGRLSDIPVPQSAALGGALGLGPQVPADPFTTFLGIFSLLSMAAEEKPVLVMADDAHWLDQSSQDALLFVARRLMAEGVAILLAVRGEMPSRFADSVLPTLVLTGLDHQDAAQLLREGTSDGIDDDVAARLVDAAAGNPLALRELPKLLSPAQLSGELDLPNPLPIGPDLRQLFLRRIAALAEPTRQALLVASASGSGDLAEISRGLELLDLDLAAFDPAEASGVITMDSSLEFTHPLVRAALYHEASTAERRRAHGALAAVVSGADAAARRAWHLAAASAGPDETVAVSVEAAAHEARARGAHAVGAMTYQRAAELSPTPDRRVRRLLAAAGEHVLAGQAARAIPLLNDARERTSDSVMRAEVEHLRGRVLMNIGPLAEAQSVLSGAAQAIEEIAPSKAASMLSDAALASFISGQVQVGEDYGRRAMVLTGGRDDGPGEINHMLFAGMLVLRGKAAEAEQHVERERQRIRSTQAADGWQFIALSAIWLMWAEEHELARIVLDGAVSEARRLSAIGLLPLPLAERAELSWRTGEGSVAYALSAEAVKLAADTGQAVTLCYALAIQTLVLASQGREAECHASAVAAVRAAEPIGAESAVSRSEAALGLLELGAGRYAQATRHLRIAHDILESQGVGEPTVVPYIGDFIESLLRVGRVAEAGDALEQLERRADGQARSWTRAVIARSRGLLVTEDAFDAYFSEALRWHAELPGGFDRARTLLAYGERLRRTGQRLLARERLREALHDFERVGAASWATRVRAELRAAGEATPEVHETELAVLTPQELQVALAVAEGRTNREVAAALFLSRKTIEFHLGNVYSKLALRSRTELVRLMAAQA